MAGALAAAPLLGGCAAVPAGPTGCSAPSPVASEPRAVLDVLGEKARSFDEKAAQVGFASLWYGRYYAYGYSCGTDDPQTVQKVWDAVKRIDCLRTTSERVTDYDDVLEFTLTDGTTYVVGFEAHHLDAGDDAMWVTQGGEALWELLDAGFEEWPTV